MVSNSLILESGKAKSLRLMLDCLTKFTIVFYFSQISYIIADISYIIACSTLLFPSDRSSQANFYAFCITHITCFSKKSVRIIAIFGLKSQNNRQIIPWKTWNHCNTAPYIPVFGKVKWLVRQMKNASDSNSRQNFLFHVRLRITKYCMYWYTL